MGSPRWMGLLSTFFHLMRRGSVTTAVSVNLSIDLLMETAVTLSKRIRPDCVEMVMSHVSLYTMKKILLMAVLAFGCLGFTSTNPISKDGYYKGIKLCGNVRVVNSYPDIKVRVVDCYADIDVKLVSHGHPSKIGEWRIVPDYCDFKIQFVDWGEDIKVHFVEAYPKVK